MHICVVYLYQIKTPYTSLLNGKANVYENTRRRSTEFDFFYTKISYNLFCIAFLSGTLSISIEKLFVCDKDMHGWLRYCLDKSENVGRLNTLQYFITLKRTNSLYSVNRQNKLNKSRRRLFDI